MNQTPAPGQETPGQLTVEQRVRRLEAQVESLTDALDTLARGIEIGPTAEPDGKHASEAARQARELLLLAKSALRQRRQ